MLDFIGDFIERYQTFIVGIIGFGGVIYTIFANAKQSREQHQREVLHDANAVRFTLSTELKILCRGYKLRIKQLSDIGGDSALIKEHLLNDAYLQMLPKIGLLTTVEIEKVMTAYALQNEYLFKLSLLGGGAESSQNLGYIEVTKEKAHIAAELHQVFLKEFESALDILKENTE